MLRLLTGAILSAASATAQDRPAPLVQTYSAADIGTAATSWITREGPDGLLYFGCNALVSFDGRRWQQSPIGRADELRGLEFGKDGRLWAAAVDELGWFDRQATGAWSYHSLRAQLPAEHLQLGEIWSAFAEGDGAVFVSTEKVLRWDGRQFQVWAFPGTRRLPAMRAGAEIYFHHFPTGLYVLDRSGPKLVVPASILGKAAVLWMEPRPAGFLFATSQGLFTYEAGQLTPFAPEASAFVRRHVLTSAVRLPDGKLVLGTYQGGLVIVGADGSLDQTLTEKDGLPTNSIFSLFVDHGHELWATSHASLFRISLGSASTFFGARSGLPAQPIRKIVRTEGKIAVASNNTIFESNPEVSHFESLDAIPRRMWELQPIPDGLLVAGAAGVMKVSAGKATVVHVTPQDVNVLVPARSEPGSMLVGEGSQIIQLAADGKSRVLIDRLPGFATTVAEDNHGRIWLGTSTQGILVAEPHATKPVEAGAAGPAFDLPEDFGPARVVATADGTVLAFSAAGGWMLNPNSTRFVPIEKFPSWGTTAVSVVAGDQTLWVLHPATAQRSATAARISIQGERAFWQPHAVDGLWNLGRPESILAEPGADGATVLWIGGATGLLRHVVAHGPVAPAPGAPLLRALARLADTDAWEPITRPLPFSTRAIAFDFAAPELARQPALHLETLLDGVDQHWMPADATSRRELTALREGRYTFQVRVVAETGVGSPATVSHFEISPPWWRTGAALAGALLALGPTGYGLYFWRVRTLRRRNAELEAKVRERTAQLAQASAAKTEFVAHMSHDIRNPLNGIVGLALALEDTPLNLRQGELVATLRECTTYLSTLVDDVLDFARIEAGAVELRPGPFSPHDLLLSIAAMFKMEAIASGASLQVETDPHLPTAYVGDAGRIQQILVNFLTNALKYAGGRIKLTATIPAGAKEEIEFAVTDEGPGISPEGQRMLFVKFSRLPGAHSQEITGTGLGLASCRLLAGMMSGSVGVRSRPGHGARFFLRLPLEIIPARPLDSGGIPLAVPLLPTCTVLLVEDTNYNAWAATAVLSKFGLTCERASTGAEALNLFAEKRHHLVLLDRNLPDMDGIEVARRIRALETKGPRAILLAVTAYCTNEDRTLCLNAGMDAFVGKPLTPEKLRRVLSAAGRRHLAAASMHLSPDVAAPSVDVSLLEFISDGTNQGLSRQIELFLAALTEAEKKLTAAASQTDFTQLAEAAHGVLSHARLIGSSALATAAAGLELAARAQDQTAFDDLLPVVRREIHSLTAAVRRHPRAERPA